MLIMFSELFLVFVEYTNLLQHFGYRFRFSLEEIAAGMEPAMELDNLRFRLVFVDLFCIAVITGIAIAEQCALKFFESLCIGTTATGGEGEGNLILFSIDGPIPRLLHLPALSSCLNRDIIHRLYLA
jgi:hypothetical protein